MDKKQSIKSKTAFTAFYLAVIIEVMMVIIDKSAFTNPIEGRLFQITFLLCFLKVCLTKYTKKEYLTIGLFLIIGAISYFVTGRNEMIRVVTFIAACKDIDMMKCLKVVFWMTLTGCMVIMMLSITGVLGTVARTMDYGRGGEETRYVLGLGHPNALQCMVCVLSILGVYLYHVKWKWYYYVVIFGINTFFFLLTDSKTAFIIAMATIIFYSVLPLIKKSKVIGALFVTGNVGIWLGSIVISIMVAKNAMCLWDYNVLGAAFSEKIRFYFDLDKLLTGRISSLIETQNHEGIMATWSLFSRPENEYYFDMGWVRLFYWYGIIPACLAIMILGIFMFYFIKKQKYAELILFSFLALYTVVEAHFVSVYIGRNYILFILGMYWYRLKQENSR